MQGQVVVATSIVAIANPIAEMPRSIWRQRNGAFVVGDCRPGYNGDGHYLPWHLCRTAQAEAAHWIASLTWARRTNGGMR